MSNDEWEAHDKSRIEGAKCALEDAALLLDGAIQFGQCPHSEERVTKAVALVYGAAVMLQRVGVGHGQ